MPIDCLGEENGLMFSTGPANLLHLLVAGVERVSYSMSDIVDAVVIGTWLAGLSCASLVNAAGVKVVLDIII
ncbi:hypothetical protein EON65_21060 [archaeon]|nr:MAG: hypothetical protein EON65_21060 [archaeon]